VFLTKWDTSMWGLKNPDRGFDSRRRLSVSARNVGSSCEATRGEPISGSDSVVIAAALLGALVGGGTTFFAEVVIERARAREAAAMVRAEIVRAQGSLGMLLTSFKKKDHKLEDLRGYRLLTPPGAYFDQLGLILASKMSLDWFTHIMSVYARWTALIEIAKKLERTGKVDANELRYLEGWVEDADVAQELLLLVATRWWPRRRRFGQLEHELRKWMRDDEARVRTESASSRMDEYFKFYKLHSGKSPK